MRCGAVAPSNYSMIGDTKTLDVSPARAALPVPLPRRAHLTQLLSKQDDFRSLLAALNWDQV